MSASRIAAFLVPLLVFPIAALSEEDASPTATWTPELSMRYRSIASTAMSPDGRLVAYVVRTPEMEGERSEFVSQIWVAAHGEGDGGDRQYTRGVKSSTAPAFSPDGRHLAFLSPSNRDSLAKTGDEEGEARNQIWTMPVDGGEPHRLTDAKADISAFRWSPDGRRIAFLMTDPETEEDEVRKKEKRDVILVNQQLKYDHLYVVELESGSPAEAVKSEPPTQRLTEGTFHVVSFDWSPDGERLVFAYQADPHLNTGFLERDISLVAATGGALTELVSRPGIDDSPLFSPDGRAVAFTSHGGRPEPVGLADVFIVPADGGTPRPLSHTPDRRAELLAWSPGGKAIFAIEEAGTTRQIFELPTDDGAVRAVTSVDGVVASPSVSRDGRHLALVIESSETPEEVYSAPLSPRADPLTLAGLTRLSAINEAVPRPPMGVTELLTWSSPDGLEIEGLLTLPVGYEKGRRVPLVLNVHGGPAGAFGQNFTGAPSIYMIQTFAAHGYAVLRPNPRGSTGYGKDFRYANVRDWGHGDYEDLMAGVDRVIALGIADPDRLFLMGWSYGGYMTSYVVTRTDRFRAASMGAGLPNLVSMVTTTDIPDYLAAHMGAEMWEDYAVYEKHSAMYRIANVVTPTQVIHGARDLRVPFTQGQEFFVALDRRGVPTEMIVYPRTPHGPREPKFLMDVTPRILAWFERFDTAPAPNTATGGKRGQ